MPVINNKVSDLIVENIVRCETGVSAREITIGAENIVATENWVRTAICGESGGSG